MTKKINDMVETLFREQLQAPIVQTSDSAIQRLNNRGQDWGKSPLNTGWAEKPAKGFLFRHGICSSHYFKQLHNIVCLIPTCAVHWFKWDNTIVVIILISVHLSTLFVVSYIPCTF